MFNSDYNSNHMSNSNYNSTYLSNSNYNYLAVLNHMLGNYYHTAAEYIVLLTLQTL